MTETGMILSNPLAGERRAGTVGLPLPGVEVRTQAPPQAATPSGAPVADGAATAAAAASVGGSGANSCGGVSEQQQQDTQQQQPGELLVRGPALFSGYWGQPDATAEAFDADGFFRTGACVSDMKWAGGEGGQETSGAGGLGTWVIKAARVRTHGPRSISLQLQNLAAFFWWCANRHPPPPPARRRHRGAGRGRPPLLARAGAHQRRHYKDRRLQGRRT